MVRGPCGVCFDDEGRAVVGHADVEHVPPGCRLVRSDLSGERFHRAQCGVFVVLSKLWCTPNVSAYAVQRARGAASVCYEEARFDNELDDVADLHESVSGKTELAQRLR